METGQLTGANALLGCRKRAIILLDIHCATMSRATSRRSARSATIIVPCCLWWRPTSCPLFWHKLSVWSCTRVDRSQVIDARAPIGARTTTAAAVAPSACAPTQAELYRGARCPSERRRRPHRASRCPCRRCCTTCTCCQGARHRRRGIAALDMHRREPCREDKPHHLHRHKNISHYPAVAPQRGLAALLRQTATLLPLLAHASDAPRVQLV